MKPFLASPNETIEAASQKLKLKMASVERDTNCPNPKEMPRRQKKDLPMNVPANPSTDARTTEVYVSVKFHSSTSEARDSLRASSCQNQRSYTVFFLYHVGTVPLHRLEAWKAACVNSWIHRHGAACGKEFVSELSCRNHACRTTAEQRQLSLLASCRFQDKPIGNYLPQTPKKTDFGSKLEAKI